jgi:hypothetical protein
MSRFLSKRSILALAFILASIFLVVYVEIRPRLAPGQAPLADISNIETLRTQFNQDAGKTRLILLVSPT